MENKDFDDIMKKTFEPKEEADRELNQSILEMVSEKNIVPISKNTIKSRCIRRSIGRVAAIVLGFALIGSVTVYAAKSIGNRIVINKQGVLVGIGVDEDAMTKVKEAEGTLFESADNLNESEWTAMKELGIPVNSELTDEEKETINDYLRNQEEMVPSDGKWYSKEALSQYGNSYSYRTYQDAIEDIAMESAFIDQSAYREEKDCCSVYDGFGQVHINDVFYYENGFFVFNQRRMKEAENYYFYTEHSNEQGEKKTLENERIYQSQNGIDFTVADLVGSNTIKSEVLAVATMDQNYLEIIFMNLTEEEIHDVLDNLRMDY